MYASVGAAIICHLKDFCRNSSVFLALGVSRGLERGLYYRRGKQKHYFGLTVDTQAIALQLHPKTKGGKKKKINNNEEKLTACHQRSQAERRTALRAYDVNEIRMLPVEESIQASKWFRVNFCQLWEIQKHSHHRAACVGTGCSTDLGREGERASKAPRAGQLSV